MCMFEEQNYKSDSLVSSMKENLMKILVTRLFVRVPRQVVHLLEEKLNDRLKPKTGLNKSLSARDQIKVFLNFFETNEFYHVVRDCYKISLDTVYR